MDDKPPVSQQSQGYKIEEESANALRNLALAILRCRQSFCTLREVQDCVVNTLRAAHFPTEPGEKK